MTFSPTSADEARADDVEVTDEELIVALADGRTVSVPLAWYPRLLHGGPEERADYRLVGGGNGIHWPRLDEDIAVDDLLRGRPSAESAGSLQVWLESRS